MLGGEAAWHLAACCGELQIPPLRLHSGCRDDKTNRQIESCGARSGSALILDLLQADVVLFPYLTDRHHGSAEGGQTTEFLLDFLEPFMPLPVRDLVRGSIALSLPILLVQLMDFSNLSPQAHNLFLKNS